MTTLLNIIPADQLLALAAGLDATINLAGAQPWANFAAFPNPAGLSGKTALAMDTGAVYRSDGVTWGSPIGYAIRKAAALTATPPPSAALTVSNPPTQAEVQAIVARLDVQRLYVADLVGKLQASGVLT